MFGKLIKNEFKSTFHSIGFIYITVAIIIALFEIAYHMNNVKVSYVALILLVLTGIAAIIITFFMVILQFNKSLYSNQGYLSFTLPVTSGQLLASKAIVACFWMVLSWLVSVFSFMVVSFKISTIIEGSEFYGYNVKDILQVFVDTMAEGEVDIKKSLEAVALFFLIFFFIIVIKLISDLYFAVTLSNTRVMQKHGALSVILVTIASVIIGLVFLSFFMTKFRLGLQINLDGSIEFVKTLTVDEGSGAMAIFSVGGIFFEVISAALLFVATSMLMDSKVNIK